MAASCAVETIFSSATISAGSVPGPQNSFVLVGRCPALRRATTQRPTFHCAPISLTAVDITASALLWRYSLRVISATRANPLTSAADDCAGAAATAGTGAGAGATIAGSEPG